MEAGPKDAVGMVSAMILIVRVLVFAFFFVAAISQFVLDMENKYGANHGKQTAKVIRNAVELLTLFTMFFVLSSAQSSGSHVFDTANEQNLPVLSYFANVTGAPFMAYMAPIVVICAIASSYFGHSLGTVEGTRYLVGLVFASAKKISNRKMDLW